MPFGRHDGLPDARDSVPADSVDLLLDAWTRRRPDLDFRPVGIVTRLARVRRHVDAQLDDVFARHGLDPATFGVLVTLARVAGEEGLPQPRLMEELGITAPVLEERIASLVRDRLLARTGEAPPVLALTAAGAERVRQAVPAHLDNERRLLAALSPDEQELLEGLLRKLLVEFEGSRPVAADGTRLGLTLLPVHATGQLRELLGLRPVDGLLVHAVQPHGAGARAGLRAGDVLHRAGRRDLRSIADLHAALAEARPAGRVDCAVVRGDGELTLELRGEAVAPAVTAGRAGDGQHVV